MSSFSYTSSSFAYSGTGRDGQTTGQAYKHTSSTNPDGTTTNTTTQNLGERPISHTQRYDTSGRELLTSGAGDATRRIEDVTDKEPDQLYSERMEDEYAKREGGA